eukprot:Colp12_sorted_trinity150504_noHs@32708
MVKRMDDLHSEDSDREDFPEEAVIQELQDRIKAGDESVFALDCFHDTNDVEIKALLGRVEEKARLAARAAEVPVVSEVPFTPIAETPAPKRGPDEFDWEESPAMPFITPMVRITAPKSANTKTVASFEAVCAKLRNNARITGSPVVLEQESRMVTTATIATTTTTTPATTTQETTAGSVADELHFELSQD